MPAWRSTAATLGASQRSTPSPIRGTGTAALRSCSIAAAMARAAAGPLRAGPVKSLARSSRWRDLAKAAISRRMAPMTPRDDWPAARAAPRYRVTASLDDRPSCQARRATQFSLRRGHCYAAKVSYRHSIDKSTPAQGLHRRFRTLGTLDQQGRRWPRPSHPALASCLHLPHLLGWPDLLRICL